MPPNFPQTQNTEQDHELPEVPGEELGEAEWLAAWTPELERRLDEMRSGAVRELTLEELEARIAERRAAREP